MPQPMPVVRQMYWAGLIPQFVAIGIFSGVAWLLLPSKFGDAAVSTSMFVGAAIYLVLCRILVRIFVHDHTLGMRAYRAGQFVEAISHFEASYRFFSAHRRLDANRSLLLGVASQNPYRVIALANMAFCYGQLGDGAKAIELYEQVLKEVPGHSLARTSLNLLNASATRDGTT